MDDVVVPYFCVLVVFMEHINDRVILAAKVPTYGMVFERLMIEKISIVPHLKKIFPSIFFS